MSLEVEIADLRAAVVLQTKSVEVLVQVVGELTHCLSEATQAMTALTAGFPTSGEAPATPAPAPAPAPAQSTTKASKPKKDEGETKPKKPTEEEVKNHAWFADLMGVVSMVNAELTELTDAATAKAKIVAVLKNFNDNGQVKGIVHDALVVNSSVLIEKAKDALVEEKNRVAAEAAKAVESEPEPAPEPDSSAEDDFGADEDEAEEVFTVDDLRVALRAHAKEHSQAEAIAVMENTAGVKSAAAVPTEMIGEVIKALKA